MSNDTHETDIEVCDRCKGKGPIYDFVNLTSQNGPNQTENVCWNCWNKERSSQLGIPFQAAQFKILLFKDVSEKDHSFYIRRRIFPTGITFEALELINDQIKGYRFAVRDDICCDQETLYQRLIEKIKKGMSKKYLQKENGEIDIKDWEAAGYFEWDEKGGGQMPMLVIDGEEYDWDTFGKMLGILEGFRFKIQIYEPSDGE